MDNQIFGAYKTAVEKLESVELKGKSIPYTSVNGNMFSQLSKEGELGIRLPEKERDEFLNRYSTGLLESYGKVLKEYVRAPAELIVHPKELKKWLEISYSYAKSLKAK